MNDSEKELRERLEQLADMWQETIDLGNMLNFYEMSPDRSDCLNDLKEVLSGDYSCLELIDNGEGK